MASVSREEFNIKEASQDEKLDHLIGKVNYIEGKIDTHLEDKKLGITFLGVLTAIILGVWNLVK